MEFLFSQMQECKLQHAGLCLFKIPKNYVMTSIVQFLFSEAGANSSSAEAVLYRIFSKTSINLQCT